MKSSFVLPTIIFGLFIIVGCKNQMTERNYILTAGTIKIPLTRFSEKGREPAKNELQLKDGYYFDTIEAGAVHKYQVDTTISWINSASIFSFKPSGDTVRLWGEGFFETTGKPLIVLIDDTIKVIINKNSKVNIEAYKTALKEGYLTELAHATLVKGEFTVINGTSKDTVKPPVNYISISTSSINWRELSFTKRNAECWTKLKFDYESMSQNEVVERLGRRFNMPVETYKIVSEPIVFKANFDEPLEDIVNRLDTAGSFFHCRLAKNQIVVSPTTIKELIPRLKR
jgi:hypothetical protein